MHPAKAVAALPGTQPVIIPLRDAALRVPTLVAGQIGFQKLPPTTQKPADTGYDQQFRQSGHGHLPANEAQREARRDAQRPKPVSAAAVERDAVGAAHGSARWRMRDEGCGAGATQATP